MHTPTGAIMAFLVQKNNVHLKLPVMKGTYDENFKSALITSSSTELLKK